MKIVKGTTDDKKDENVLWNKDGKYAVIIRKDKVIKSHGNSVFQLNDELNSRINESLKYYPRSYLLSLVRKSDKPLGIQNFHRLLFEIFDGKKIGVDIMRSAYVTYFYNRSHFTMQDKQRLADMMRSSVHLAQTVYHKIDTSMTKMDIFINQLTNDEDKKRN